MKALLINPRKSDRATGAKKNRNVRYPAGLYSISATLEANGFEAPVVDLEIADLTLDEAIRRERPELIGITSVTANRFQAIDAVRRARAAAPRSVIAVGGPHFSFTAEDTLRHVPEIDLVVRGEGEAALLEVMQLLQAGAPLDSAPGVSTLSGGCFVNNADRPPIRDLDSIPPVQWHRIPWDKYDYRFMNMPCVSIQTGRGCPVNCSFCSTTKMWGKHLRWRDPVKVMDEVELLVRERGFQAVFFDDDTFTLNRRHLLAICDEIQRRQLSFRWVCQSRVDTVNQDILRTMKEAGCHYVYFGVETGSQAMLESINKKITREQVLQTVRDCKAVGLLSHALFMYSLPGETDADRGQTFAFIEELIAAGLDMFSANPTIIYPGTEVEAAARSRGVLPPRFSWSEPYASPKNASIQPELGNTPLYTEMLSLDGMLRVEAQIQEMRRPLQAAMRLKEPDAFREAPRFLLGFTRVRNVEALRQRVGRGEDLLAAMGRRVRGTAAR